MAPADWLANRRQLVHARAVVADVAFDLDLDGGVETGGHRMRAVRVENAPVLWAGRPSGEVVQALVQVPQGDGGEIDDLHRGRLDRRPHAQTFCRSQA